MNYDPLIDDLRRRLEAEGDVDRRIELNRALTYAVALRKGTVANPEVVEERLADVLGDLENHYPELSVHAATILMGRSDTAP